MTDNFGGTPGIINYMNHNHMVGKWPVNIYWSDHDRKRFQSQILATSFSHINLIFVRTKDK